MRKRRKAQDGLGGLVLGVTQDDKSATGGTARAIKRRPAFASTEIYLPKVTVVESGARAAHSKRACSRRSMRAS